MNGRAVARGSIVAAVPILAGACSGASPDAVEPAWPVLGVDLSYVNELEDCGATFTGAGLDDPFAILAASGANLVRARLWHDPDWTDYSTVDDVIETFRRARQQGMRTLLDFHYSDEWADPGRQNVPRAWAGIDDVDELAAALGDYTTGVLARFDEAGVLPDMVQVGNETNGGMMKTPVGLDWSHDLPLFRAGVAAVRTAADDAGRPIDVVIHIAQPENALWWFAEAEQAGLDDFDVIGLSYYPQWSRYSLGELGSTVGQLAAAYDKRVLVVEAAYPWTMEPSIDDADNVLDQAIRGYPTTPAGQASFMTDLTQVVVANGGDGVVYWEPAWISTSCATRWGVGSHWENATLFDFDGALHEGASYLAATYDALTLPAGEPAATVVDAGGDAARPDADLTGASATHTGGVAVITATFAGDPREAPGSVIVAIDSESGHGGDGGRRPYDFASGSRPELLVETSWNDEPGVGHATPNLLEWRDSEWQQRAFTGRVEYATAADGGTTITWVVPGALVPDGAAAAVMTAERGRAGGLADVLGTDRLDGVETPLVIGAAP